jgi:AraC-like DNA-binding protein
VPTSRVLFSAPDLTVGAFVCPPHDDAWQALNTVGAGHHVVFPQLPVGIEQDGRPAVVADQNNVVLYPDGQIYRRRLVSDRGDRCVFFIPSPHLLTEMTADGGESGFAVPAAPIEAWAYLLQQRAVRALGRSPEPDGIREILYDVLRHSVTRVIPPRRAKRPATERAHLAAVEAVKLYLSTHANGRILLDDVGRHVNRSPFEVARIFRSLTGTTVHAYLTQLRLRSALHRLDDGAPLSTIAVDGGFASHAHFTDAFTRVFGAGPDRVRRTKVSQLRTILEAASPERP